MSTPTTAPAVSVLVSLPSELVRTIDTLAKGRGQSREQFIVGFLQQHVSGSAALFEEAMAPLAEDFRQSGMTEEDLDALVEQERRAIWDEKHS